ncbi:hypothetical protein [Rubritalea tangerina]|uniref:Uncharacterized protein n=1 Tax=Rubritalea tangerina TaxID=430798 RepID=A0ABW4Z9S6_9BACT
MSHHPLLITLCALILTSTFTASKGTEVAFSHPTESTTLSISKPQTKASPHFFKRQNDSLLFAARQPSPSLLFKVSSPTPQQISEIHFRYGFNETFHPNPITPIWQLTTSHPSSTTHTGSLPTFQATGNKSQTYSAKFSPPIPISKTPTTFTFQFLTKEKRHAALNRSHQISNITLVTGESTFTTATLIAVGNITLSMSTKR